MSSNSWIMFKVVPWSLNLWMLSNVSHSAPCLTSHLPASVPQPRKESRLFPLLVVSRVAFVPLLMLCNVQGRTYLPVYFHHDAAFTAIMALFSFSSGYFVCLSMSYAPQWVATLTAEMFGVVFCLLYVLLVCFLFLLLSKCCLDEANVPNVG